MSGERPRSLYEDIGLLLGAVLAGAGVRGLTDVYGSWAMLSLGLLLIAWVMARREYDAKDPWVRGDTGIAVLDFLFDGPSVTFTVMYRAYPGNDLWISCD